MAISRNLLDEKFVNAGIRPGFFSDSIMEKLRSQIDEDEVVFTAFESTGNYARSQLGLGSLVINVASAAKGVVPLTGAPKLFAITNRNLYIIQEKKMLVKENIDLIPLDRLTSYRIKKSWAGVTSIYLNCEDNKSFLIEQVRKFDMERFESSMKSIDVVRVG